MPASAQPCSEHGDALLKRQKGPLPPRLTFPYNKQTKEMQRGIRKSQGGHRTESKVEASGCFSLGAQKMPLRERGMSWDTGTGVATRRPGDRSWEGLWRTNEPQVLGKQRTVSGRRWDKQLTQDFAGLGEGSKPHSRCSCSPKRKENSLGGEGSTVQFVVMIRYDMYMYLLTHNSRLKSSAFCGLEPYLHHPSDQLPALTCWAQRWALTQARAAVSGLLCPTLLLQWVAPLGQLAFIDHSP